MQPFQPLYGSNQVVTSAAVSAVVGIPSGRGADCLRVVNTGTGLVHVRTFSSKDSGANGVASAADFPIPPGVASTIYAGQHDRLAHISAAGTTLQIIAGQGF
ncbi:hypothetical protein [Pseudorhodoferax sp. Leaf274]|uniref:hypothetical protein n=1 Tax=Pseudorhodoferax sp. Leaf274 TaxID=1736318 RepID=UPI000703B83D|nr:hypothetical protein [Pseudorhodoferax sp. Leaf274]KQP36137.1 hypothetical protein ASF44_16345 [Pseudorhodoferax sp. Leaf274]